jgi:hypothetical protein
MKSKFFFEQFKKEIKEDHKQFKTHQEATELGQERCNHQGKVKMVGNILRCQCGAAWSGSQIEKLLDIFNKKD